jgi:signal transduction histidine kinase
MAGNLTLSPIFATELPTFLPGDLAADATALDDEGRRPRTARDWIVDLSCFALAVAIGATNVRTNQQSADPASAALRNLDITVGLLACLALWWRRRWPLTLALLSTVPGSFSLMGACAVLMLLFTVAVHRPVWIALAVAAAHALCFPAFELIRGFASNPTWMDVWTAATVTVIVVGWGILTRTRRLLVIALTERAVRAEAEQQLRVDQARHLERARIAREMHDVLAHRISLLSVHAGALEFRTDASRDQMAQAAGVIRATAHQALQELREVIGVLREDERGDVPQPPQPGLTEIPALIAESTAAGARVQFRCEVEEPSEVPGSVARTAYRVVQEGLTNARKHAPGQPVDVFVGGRAGTEVIVEVVSPAPTWPSGATLPGAGLGLIGLSERVQLGGGRLDHGRDDDGRFRLRARLPWPG